MKKIAIYAFALLAMGFTACTEDFGDWAEPQGFEQEEAVTVSFSATAGAPIDMATVTTEKVSVFTPSVTAEGMTSVSYAIEIEGTDFETDAQGNVSVEELKKVTESKFGKAPEQRTLAATVSAFIAMGEEEILKETAPIEIKVTLVAPDIAQAYYLVGDMFGWDNTTMQKFEHSETNVYDDPIFKIVFNVSESENGQYWKIIPQTNIDANDFWANPGVIGVAIDGDDSMSGNLVNENAQAGRIVEAGKYVMTIDMLNYTYNIEKAPEFENMYVTGSGTYDWKWNNPAQQFVPVWGEEGTFWSIQYFAADAEIKFCPDAEWSGREFGYSEEWIDAASIELAGLSDSSGNIKVGKAGWYTIYITINATSKSVKFYNAEVYLMGPTIDASWGENLEAAKFTTPETADGEFVSPAFTGAGEIRAYVSVPELVGNWWKAEFMVFDGKIVYRGNGGDQERIQGEVGQKLYLNFTNITGRIE